MEEGTRNHSPRQTRMDCKEALADIQARLEMFEDDLDHTLLSEALGGASDGRLADLSAQADEIERMLEELMTDDGVHVVRQRRSPARREGGEWTPELSAMYREEEESAGEIEDAVQRHTPAPERRKPRRHV